MSMEELDLHTGRSMDFILVGACGSLDQGLGLALRMSKAVIDGDGSGERHARQRNGMSKGAEVRKLWERRLPARQEPKALNAVLESCPGF